MPRHRPDRRRIKVHYTYTVEEAARTVGVAKGTIRRWLKNGLPATDGRKPLLIRGADLREYLGAKAKSKQAVPPGQCYCVKCRAAQRPDGAMAEYVVITATSGNLRALCPNCGNLMHRRTSLAQLQAIGSLLDVTTVERVPRLVDTTVPSINDH